jgi:hypothetical protein
MLQKHFHLQESAMDSWPFWMLEENVKLVNEIIEEEETQRKKQEDEQGGGMNNFNANSMMSSANDMTRNLSSSAPKF